MYSSTLKKTIHMECNFYILSQPLVVVCHRPSPVQSNRITIEIRQFPPQSCLQ